MDDTRGWERPTRVRRLLRWPAETMREVADLATKERTSFTAFVSRSVELADAPSLSEALPAVREDLSSDKPMMIRTLYWEDRWEQYLEDLQGQMKPDAGPIPLEQLLLACVQSRVQPHALPTST